jgi:hypothetical protein
MLCLSIGHKGITGNLFVRMGLATCQSIFHGSNNYPSIWNMYSAADLSSRCEQFEAILNDKTAYGAYKAIAWLCGSTIAQYLANEGKVTSPPKFATVTAACQMSLSKGSTDTEWSCFEDEVDREDEDEEE